MVLKIFRATDAFLYLPTYVAEEFGIFDTMLNSLGIDNVEFITPNDGSDIKAIEMMLGENKNSEDSIAIAICDPTAFLSVRNDEEDYQQCRVIGSIINKLPFWAVDHVDRKFDKLEDMRNTFKKVVHYKEDLITGYYLGTKLLNKSKIRKGITVDFGQEIFELNKINKGREKAVAVTADVISLARGMNNPIRPLKINYRFSLDGKYLTTGIITTKTICDNYSTMLSKLIEGVQQSIYILYASNKIAERVCGILVQNSKFSGLKAGEVLSDIEIKSIISLIKDEKFYPADLDISKEGWNEAIFALAKTEHWSNEELENKLSYSFDMYIDNRFIHKSEKSIAQQFGITSETFQDDIDQIIDLHLSKEKRYLDEIQLMKTKYADIEPFAIKLAKNISFPIRYLRNVLSSKNRRVRLYSILFLSGIGLSIKEWHDTSKPLKSEDYFWIILPVLSTIISGIVINLITSPNEDVNG